MKHHIQYRSVLCGLLTLVLAGISAPAFAQQKDKRFEDWTVFTLDQGGKKVCYIASTPTKKEGNYAKRDEPYLLITHRTAELDEVSTSSGYPYKEKSEVKVSIDGGETFKLFTKDDLAWTYTEKADKELVAAMKKGKKLNVSGGSAKDTTSSDTYSLKGISAAYKRMKELCK